jgi:transcriptional regulator with XRE-family HTH domain
MIVGDRLREMREAKQLSQGDGHTVPAIETLEKLARAFEVPLYQLFDGEEPPKLPNLLKKKSSAENVGGSQIIIAECTVSNCCFP